MTSPRPTVAPPSGLWVPIVTPFERDGSLDLVSLRRLAERLLTDGVTGLVALGTTGEPATLAADERRAVVVACADVCASMGRRLMVGAGTNATAGTIAEVDRLTDGLDINAALVVVPYYTRPSEAAVVEHYGLVADASPVPLVAYNVPYRTGRGLSAAAILDVGRHPNVIGLKQAVGALDADTLDVLAGAGPDFAILAGDDAFIAPTILMGGRGAIAAAAHLATSSFRELTERAAGGDVEGTRAIAERLLGVVAAGFAEPSPAVWKGALARSGEIATDTVRRPMTPASTGAVDRALAALSRATDERCADG